jgi:murein hydrolase activator
MGKPSVIWWCAMAALTLPALAVEPDNEAKLRELRARIESVRRSIQAEATRRDSLVDELQSADLAIQSAREQGTDLRRRRQALDRQMAELEQAQTSTRQAIANQRAALAATVRLAYINGEQGQLRLLLSQRQPGAAGRMLVYHGYIARQRAAQVGAINDRLAHLQLLNEQVAAQSAQLQEVERLQESQLKRLASARQQRRQSLAAAQTALRDRTAQLGKLQRDAATLERLLDELRRAAAEFPALTGQSFAAVQGKLPWPVAGRVLAKFGQPRNGGPLKWQGVVIGAPAGSTVRAPFRGRVIYADWLAGMGLLVVLDHGDGYLSLYGQNEQIFRKVGDTVASGDTLAALADRGNGAGELYLEIRKAKQPLDPQRWLKKP